MYEYSDRIADSFFTSAQAMKQPYSNSKYSQTIQEIPKAIETNDMNQIQEIDNEVPKLNELDFVQINIENASSFHNNSQNTAAWAEVPQFDYNDQMKKKIESIKSSTKEKIEKHYCIPREYLKKSQELSKLRYPVSILYDGKKVAESYIGYTIERPIGNESEIMLTKFIIHGTTTKPIFSFYSLRHEQIYSSSENFFEAFQRFKDLIFNFHIFSDEVPAFESISPLKFVKIIPLEKEYFSLV